VGAGQIASNSIVAGDITSGAVTSGTIAAGAVSTTELAAGAITSAKIAAGTIVSSNIAALTITGANVAAGTISADKMNVSTLSAITANLGTVNAGSITANVSLDVGTAANEVRIDNTGMTIGGQLNFKNVAGNPCLTMYGSGSYSGSFVRINGYGGSIPPFFQASDGSNNVTINGDSISTPAETITSSLTISSGATIYGPGSIKLVPGSGDNVNVVAGEFGTAGPSLGYMDFYLNGREVKVQFFNP
jgi:hypothetical protein